MSDPADPGVRAAGAMLHEDAPDLELLRAFEPIVRYNEGELFFPASVDGYLAECDLLQGTSGRDRQVVVPRGGVTKDVIATWVTPPGQSLYLRYVQEPRADERRHAPNITKS